jgi:hypothetical protein
MSLICRLAASSMSTQLAAWRVCESVKMCCASAATIPAAKIGSSTASHWRRVHLAISLLAYRIPYTFQNILGQNEIGQADVIAHQTQKCL